LSFGMAGHKLIRLDQRLRFARPSFRMP
jgi:hypothetical protein